MSHRDYLKLVLAEAHQAALKGEVPVAAALVDRDRQEIITIDHNRCLELGDETAHAELLVMRQAAKKIKLTTSRLALYVTLEPCAMCAGAILHNRISQVIYGADDPACGASGTKLSILGNQALQPQPEIIAGIEERQCRAILQAFFRTRRS